MAEVMSFALAACVVAERFAPGAGPRRRAGLVSDERRRAGGGRAGGRESAPRSFGALVLPRLRRRSGPRVARPAARGAAGGGRLLRRRAERSARHRRRRCGADRHAGPITSGGARNPRRERRPCRRATGRRRVGGGNGARAQRNAGRGRRGRGGVDAGTRAAGHRRQTRGLAVDQLGARAAARRQRSGRTPRAAGCTTSPVRHSSSIRTASRRWRLSSRCRRSPSATGSSSSAGTARGGRALGGRMRFRRTWRTGAVRRGWCFPGNCSGTGMRRPHRSRRCCDPRCRFRSFTAAGGEGAKATQPPRRWGV